MKFKLLSNLLIGSLIVSTTATTTVLAREWKANTPEQILINKDDKTYTIKWGDTLWAISQKVNIKIDTLAQLNGLTDPNFIIEGTTLHFDGNKVTITAPGKTKSKTESKSSAKTSNDTSNKSDNDINGKSEIIITESDKVEPNQEIGKPVEENNTDNSTEPPKENNSEENKEPEKPEQTGIEGLIAKSPTAQLTNQIIGVVGSGSNATVYLFEKDTTGTWSKKLTTNGFVGSEGIGKASEYVSRTPKGSYSLGFAFGTGANPGTQLEYKQITQHSYWISNVNDSQYNTWQERPNGSSSLDEHLASYPQQYEYAITLNYNGGIGGGSAFFLHVSNGAATAGCIAVPRDIMQQFMTKIQPGSYIINVNEESELASY